ncbi:MAG: 2-oxoacid:ferredoxin oxidoreductase subunit beta [Candidatus Eremiobacteraeota bacterium]|nr:2-oxoacid:ferredoxin oxidoreductase subunit beta [Candidatus Eremiobacteraeota bacterium]
MRERNSPTIVDFLRSNKKFPTVWCPGCGIGVVLGSIIRAVHSLGLNKDYVAMVSGIGCSGRMPVYLDFHTIHTTHGRALSYATGLKLARPEMEVIVILGDGDGLAIGGNHFIHTARRNIELTAIVINNRIYGMTGGQYSPATPTACFSTTSTYGNIDQPFDISKIAEVAGAAFVARSTVYHVMEMGKYIEKAIEKKGFSVVEVMSNCHTYFGRMNNIKSPIDMLTWFKDNTTIATGEGEGADASGKLKRGIFVDKDVKGFIEEYQNVIVRARRQKKYRKIS